MSNSNLFHRWINGPWMIFAILSCLGCALGDSSNGDDESPDEWHFNFDNALLLIDARVGDLDVETDADEVTYYKMTGDHEVQPAVWGYITGNDSSSGDDTSSDSDDSSSGSDDAPPGGAVFKNSYATTRGHTFFRGPDDSFYFSENVEEESTCALKKYVRPDEFECVLEIGNSAVGFDGEGSLYFEQTTSGDLVRLDLSGGGEQVLVDFAAGFASVGVVSQESIVLLFADPEEEFMDVYVVYADGTADSLTEEGLYGEDLFVDASDRFFVLGRNTEDDSSGLYEVLPDLELKTTAFQLILSDTALSEEGADSLVECEFLANMDRRLVLVCNDGEANGGLILNADSDNPSFKEMGCLKAGTRATGAYGSYLYYLDEIVAVRGGFVYAVTFPATETSDEEEEAECIQNDDPSSLPALKSDSLLPQTHDDTVQETLVKIDADTGEEEVLWTGEDSDIDTMDWIWIEDDNTVYFSGTCVAGVEAGVGGEDIEAKCLGYRAPEDSAFQIILSNEDIEDNFVSHITGIWEY